MWHKIITKNHPKLVCACTPSTHNSYCIYIEKSRHQSYNSSQWSRHTVNSSQKWKKRDSELVTCDMFTLWRVHWHPSIAWSENEIATIRKSNAKKTHRPRPNDSDTLYPWVRGFQPLTPPQKNWSYPQPAWAHLAVGALKEKLCVGNYIDLKPTTDRVPWRCPFLE